MRAIVVGLLAFLFAAGAVVPDEAESRPHKRQHAKRSHQGSGDSAHAPRRDSGYVQHQADKMRFGTAAWWDQMRREGRLGGETP
jgi:hypothetical protein